MANLVVINLRYFREKQALLIPNTCSYYFKCGFINSLQANTFRQFFFHEYVVLILQRDICLCYMDFL